jgi:hypothetical protein
MRNIIHLLSPTAAAGRAVMQRVYAQSDAKSLFCFGIRSEPAARRIEGATELLYSDAIGGSHGFIGKSVFYANVDADHRRLDRNRRNESLERLLRFQLGYRFCSGMRKQLTPPSAASPGHATLCPPYNCELTPNRYPHAKLFDGTIFFVSDPARTATGISSTNGSAT